MNKAYLKCYYLIFCEHVQIANIKLDNFNSLHWIITPWLLMNKRYIIGGFEYLICLEFFFVRDQRVYKI